VIVVNGNNTRIEPQFEIECPRCYDTMTLCSNFEIISAPS